MLVFVINKHGKPLMPCNPRKTRLLLKEGKAKVVKRTPFTIQLLFGSSGYQQPVTLGVDSGYNHIGLSAVTGQREVFSAEVELRDDVVKLNSERRQYRRSRRHRKTWHRKPRFLNRKKPENWLAPSIQHKLDSHIKIINQAKEILPVSRINIEVAAFDIQRIKNPDILGIEYQNGVQKGFWNVREYVLHRDGHLCQHCKGKSKDAVLEVHHLVSRQIGGDSPNNLITLCSTCHGKVSLGKLKLDAKLANLVKVKVKAEKGGWGFKAETFMSLVRWQIVDKLRERERERELGAVIGAVNCVCVVSATYGYITKQKRLELKLPKSHTNDAFVIADGVRQKRMAASYYLKQVRKCNRKLFKGDRSHIRNTTERFILGFQRYDKVRWNGWNGWNGKKGGECFIFGRRVSGYFDLRKLDGSKICASAKAKELSLLERAKTLLIERRTTLLPFLTEGVSES